jgi:hypothetical protein
MSKPKIVEQFNDQNKENLPIQGQRSYLGSHNVSFGVKLSSKQLMDRTPPQKDHLKSKEYVIDKSISKGSLQNGKGAHLMSLNKNRRKPFKGQILTSTTSNALAHSPYQNQ